MSAADWAAVMRGGPDEIALHVRSAAEHGFRAAQVTWGQMLLDGRDVARDTAAALGWFRRAAEAGLPDGLNMVGRCHELGWGTAPDHPEAARWFRKAAERGSDWGAYNLGCMLLYGDGIEHEPIEARAWLERSAELGNAKAMGLLGRCAEEGWGGPADPTAARLWYERGAETGDCWAQCNLATILLAEGAQAEALRWLRRSVEIGTPNYLDALAADLASSDDAELLAVAAAARARRGEWQQTGAAQPEAPTLRKTLLRRFGRA